jgi:hypothetical protein
MTLSKKVTSIAISTAMKHAGIYDLESWGIDHEIKTLFNRSEYYGKPTVTIDGKYRCFDPYPDQCFWEDHGPNEISGPVSLSCERDTEWVFYLIGTLRVDVSVSWGEGRSLTSTIELTSVTYPLGVDTYEFMREHIPTAKKEPEPMVAAEYRVYVYCRDAKCSSTEIPDSKVIGTVDTKLHYGDECPTAAVHKIKKCIAAINNVPFENVYAKLTAI